MERHAYEQTHETSITKLIAEFGEDEIRRLYEQQRKVHEKDATIPDFLPVLTYKNVRERLATQAQS